VLELGEASSAGHPKGEVPVLRDGTVVARLRASNWEEAGTAVAGDREWVLATRNGGLTGRWSAEPEDAVRLCANTAVAAGTSAAVIGGTS
jgi:hypothetical protein